MLTIIATPAETTKILTLQSMDEHNEMDARLVPVLLPDSLVEQRLIADALAARLFYIKISANVL